MKRSKLTPVLLILLAAAGTLTTLHGVGQTRSDRSPEFTPGTALLQVGIDPETRDLVPAMPGEIPELDPATREALRRDTAGLVPILHPDGSVTVNLQGRFRSASFVTLDAGGRAHVRCLDDPQAADSSTAESPARVEVQ